MYEGFTEHHPTWKSLVWVELLVEPEPGTAFMEPLMRTADIGGARGVPKAMSLGRPERGEGRGRKPITRYLCSEQDL